MIRLAKRDEKKVEVGRIIVIIKREESNFFLSHNEGLPHSPSRTYAYINMPNKTKE